MPILLIKDINYDVFWKINRHLKQTYWYLQNSNWFWVDIIVKSESNFSPEGGVVWCLFYIKLFYVLLGRIYVKNFDIPFFFYICPLFLPANGTSTKLSIKVIDHSKCLCLSLLNRKNEDGGEEFHAFLEPTEFRSVKSTFFSHLMAGLVPLLSVWATFVLYNHQSLYLDLL